MPDTRKAKQARGSLKEALGKITGDAEIEAQGRAEKAAHSPVSTRRTRSPSPRTDEGDPKI